MKSLSEFLVDFPKHPSKRAQSYVRFDLEMDDCDSPLVGRLPSIIVRAIKNRS